MDIRQEICDESFSMSWSCSTKARVLYKWQVQSFTSLTSGHMSKWQVQSFTSLTSGYMSKWQVQSFTCLKMVTCLVMLHASRALVVKNFLVVWQCLFNLQWGLSRAAWHTECRAIRPRYSSWSVLKMIFLLYALIPLGSVRDSKTRCSLQMQYPSESITLKLSDSKQILCVYMTTSFCLTWWLITLWAVRYCMNITQDVR